VEKLKVFGIAGSPRTNGNTETLLDWALESAGARGADVRKIRVCSMKFSPCLECGCCDATGECVQDDDMHDIYPEFLAADRIVIATPMFFMNMPAQMKAFIDRFQCLWARKYLLNQPLRADPGQHAGYVLAAGGTKGQSLFHGLNQLLKCFFSIVDVDFDEASSLYYWKIDKKGAIEKREGAREEAAALGELIAKRD
jgi:multimeric flavodoxin WrbA